LGATSTETQARELSTFSGSLATVEMVTAHFFSLPFLTRPRKNDSRSRSMLPRMVAVTGTSTFGCFQWFERMVITALSSPIGAPGLRVAVTT
jgi:hypothetical protein